MKLLIASDIHGSYKYANLLLEQYAKEQPDKLILLGDILYHGPRNDLPEEYAPKKVIEILNPLAEQILCVRGNCEAEVDQMVLNFPVMADYAVVMDASLELFLTHGHIFNEEKLPPLPKNAAFLYGHTHIPVLKREGDLIICNPGSVSIPKNGSTHGYVWYEDGTFWRKCLNGEIEAELRAAAHQ